MRWCFCSCFDVFLWWCVYEGRDWTPSGKSQWATGDQTDRRVSSVQLLLAHPALSRPSGRRVRVPVHTWAVSHTPSDRQTDCDDASHLCVCRLQGGAFNNLVLLYSSLGLFEKKSRDLQVKVGYIFSLSNLPTSQASDGILLYYSGPYSVRDFGNCQVDQSHLLQQPDVQWQRRGQLPGQRLAECDDVTGAAAHTNLHRGNE